MKYWLVLLFVLLLFFLKQDSGHGMPKKALKPNTRRCVDCMMLDTSNIARFPSSCFSQDGKILNIRTVGAVGTVRYTWYDINNLTVGTNADLVNVAPGPYVLQVSDESKCKAIRMAFTVDIKNPVSIDNSPTIITPATCNNADGSVTNIGTTNAVKFAWYNDQNILIRTTKDLTGVSNGNYSFIATNQDGCSIKQIYVVPSSAHVPAVIRVDTSVASCNKNGSLTLTFDAKPSDPPYRYSLKTLYEVNEHQSGAIIYNPSGPTQLELTNLIPGANYTLTLIDPNSCITKLGPFIVNIVNYHIVTDDVIIHTDICGQDLGTIIGIKVAGGDPPPNPNDSPSHGYFWTDSTGKRVGGQAFLAGVPAGKYYLKVVNQNNCVATASFVIPDSVSITSTPKVNDIKMCLAGNAAIEVLNKDPGAHYRLYDSTQTLIDTSVAGYFLRKVDHTTVFYIGSINGVCESPKTKVTVTIVNPGVSITNAFTPNNDGINDYWQITGLENYPGTEVSVFNRNGQRVFHSINYVTPFNGRYNGANLPSGVYYYIIDTKKPDCRGGISGSLTIIR